MEKYQKTVAGNSHVALIHVSQDVDEDAAERWATAESFPWLTVLPGDVKRSGLMDYFTGTGIPFYTLVDADGNPVASGSTAVFAKAAELGKGAE